MKLWSFKISFSYPDPCVLFASWIQICNLLLPESGSRRRWKICQNIAVNTQNCFFEFEVNSLSSSCKYFINIDIVGIFFLKTMVSRFVFLLLTHCILKYFWILFRLQIHCTLYSICVENISKMLTSRCHWHRRVSWTQRSFYSFLK